MAKKHKDKSRGGQERQRGAAVSHPGWTVEGGIATVDAIVQTTREHVRPRLAAWVDAATGQLVARRLITPADGDDDAVAEAVEALMEQLPGADASHGRRDRRLGMPQWIRVNRQDLAAALTSRLAHAGIAVEHAERLPKFEAMIEQVASYMEQPAPVIDDELDEEDWDDDLEPTEPFSWEIDGALVADLFGAAHQFARLMPWLYMEDTPPLAVRLGSAGPQRGVETLYASVLGHAGAVYGAAFYYSLDDYYAAAQQGSGLTSDIDEETYDRIAGEMRRSGMPVESLSPDDLRDLIDAAQALGTAMEDGAPAQDAIALYLLEEEEVEDTYREWLEGQQIAYVEAGAVPTALRTGPAVGVGNPDVRETVALTLALRALIAFFGQHGGPMSRGRWPDEPATYVARLTHRGQSLTVPVILPAPGFDATVMEAAVTPDD